MPSRWDRMVEKVTQDDVPQWPAYVTPSDAAKLLARQQARVVRMVKKIKAENISLYEQETDPRLMDCWRARIAGLNDILAALRAEGKGKK